MIRGVSGLSVDYFTPTPVPDHHHDNVFDDNHDDEDVDEVVPDQDDDHDNENVDGDHHDVPGVTW